MFRGACYASGHVLKGCVLRRPRALLHRTKLPAGDHRRRRSSCGDDDASWRRSSTGWAQSSHDCRNISRAHFAPSGSSLRLAKTRDADLGCRLDNRGTSRLQTVVMRTRIWTRMSTRMVATCSANCMSWAVSSSGTVIGPLWTWSC